MLRGRIQDYIQYNSLYMKFKARQNETIWDRNAYTGGKSVVKSKKMIIMKVTIVVNWVGGQRENFDQEEASGISGMLTMLYFLR